MFLCVWSRLIPLFHHRTSWSNQLGVNVAIDSMYCLEQWPSVFANKQVCASHTPSHRCWGRQTGIACTQLSRLLLLLLLLSLLLLVVVVLFVRIGG